MNNTNNQNDESAESKSNSSGSYSISNVFRYIYTLKTNQKPSSSALNDDKKSTNSQNSSRSSINLNAINENDGATKQFWMPDDQVKECYECNEKFTTFRRRHHCRVCGQIFCGKCSEFEIPSQLIWPNSSGKKLVFL
jgi:hypothetical protein